MINLHSHTQFCDGRASMEQILEAAHKAGFHTWGFSPHAPISIESPCNMESDSIGAYFAEVDRLRSLYPDMKVMRGMEVDYLNPGEGPGTALVKSYGLDYIIGSVHFIPNQKGKYIDIDGSSERFKRNLANSFNGDLEYVVRTFWKQTQEMILIGGFDIIGHIDKIALNAVAVEPEIEKTGLYRQLADETIDLAIKSGMAIEINTKHYERFGRFYPNPRFWRRIMKAGVSMSVNTDTHETSGILTGYADAMSLKSSFDK